MSATIKPSRSIYAPKLAEFPELAIADALAFSRAGKWREFFNSRIGQSFDGRIVFEIGCFDAGFLAGIAAEHPTTGFVGLDWKCKAIYDGAKRISEMGLKNVSLLRARGQDLLRIFNSREVDEIWVFHPDPCDRDVELKNRLLAEPFLSDAHRVLRDVGSSICIKTDHAGYFQWMLGMFGLPEPDWSATRRVRKGDLMRREDIPCVSEVMQQLFQVSLTSSDFWLDAAAQTHTSQRLFAETATLFEGRFIRKHMPIYYFELQKK